MIGGGGAERAPPPIFICVFWKTIEKVIRLCTVLIFFFFFFVKIGAYYRHFSRFFRSILSIYLQNYVKNGLIFKTANPIIFFSTQCIILLLFLLFSQIKIGGHFDPPPPPIKTKVCKPPIITKVKCL